MKPNAMLAVAAALALGASAIEPPQRGAPYPYEAKPEPKSKDWEQREKRRKVQKASRKKNRTR